MKGWLSNLGSALLALALAVTIWVVAVREDYPSGEFTEPIPVSRSGLPDNLSVFGDILSEVRIQIQAPKDRWRDLKARDFTAWVDLSGLRSGEYDVAVQVKSPDPQVSVIGVDPPVIRVRLEERHEKLVPVRVNIMDAPAFGYEWQTPVITPTQVTVSGSAPLTDEVATASVDVYLRGARATAERTQRVSVRNAAGEPVGFVDVTPRDISVTVPVMQLPGYREVAVIVEPTGQPASGYTVSGVTADPKLVTLQGSPEVISALSGYITVPVDVSDASSDVVDRIPLRLPESVSTLDGKSVDVRVAIRPISGVQSIQRKPTVQGLAPGLSYTLTLETANVFLSGPVPKLNALKSEDSPVILDLSGLGPGLHVITPQVLTPEGIAVEGISPETMEVTIGVVPTTTPEASPTPTAAPRR